MRMQEVTGHEVRTIRYRRRHGGGRTGCRESHEKIKRVPTGSTWIMPKRRRETDADFGTIQRSAANTVIGIKGDLRQMMQSITGAGLLFFASLAAFAQPAFEVASVKPAPPPSDNRMRVGMSGDAGRVNFSNVTLIDVMARAYNVKDKQISGPDWLKSERYDIVATLPAGAPRDQTPMMLQSLLEERFKLSLHRETKVLPIYALVVGKNGSRLHKADGEAGLRMSMSPKG